MLDAANPACSNPRCGHPQDQHVRHTGVCRHLLCECKAFKGKRQSGRPKRK